MDLLVVLALLLGHDRRAVRVSAEKTLTSLNEKYDLRKELSLYSPSCDEVAIRLKRVIRAYARVEYADDRAPIFDYVRLDEQAPKRAKEFHAQVFGWFRQYDEHYRYHFWYLDDDYRESLRGCTRYYVSLLYEAGCTNEYVQSVIDRAQREETTNWLACRWYDHSWGNYDVNDVYRRAIARYKRPK